jgi:formate dehydrogenase subunit beta
MLDGVNISKPTEQAIRELLRSLLENGQVKGVLVLGKVGGVNGGVAYSLFTDPDAFGEDGAAQPLLPFMPANAGGLLSRLTLKGPLTESVAAVIRPCEIRAFIELVKLNQCSMDNILLISSTCGGVYPLNAGLNGVLEETLTGYWEAVKQGLFNDDVRSTCRACTNFLPENADITIALLGETEVDSQCTFYLNTEKGCAFVERLEGLIGTRLSGELENKLIPSIRDRRKAYREEFFAGIEIGQAGLIHTFGRCIDCHACMAVCPICYCNLCYFDSAECEHAPDFYEGGLERKGGQRVPPDIVFFQLGRLTHMSISCVGCGMCSDVCPADIPVSAIFSKVGASVQALFDYVPGSNVTEEIPLRTFEVEEFAQIETEEKT